MPNRSSKYYKRPGMARARAYRGVLDAVAVLGEQQSAILAVRAPGADTEKARKHYFRTLDGLRQKLFGLVRRYKQQDWPRLPRRVEAARLKSAYMSMDPKMR